MLPLSNVLGTDNDKNFDRKVRQIGEVTYNPPDEGEEMRHLKVNIADIVEIAQYCCR